MSRTRSLALTLALALMMCLGAAGVAPASAALPLKHSLAAGGFHSIWIGDDGLMWGLGYNGEGQLGDGTRTNRTRPVVAGTSSDWTQCSAGYYTSYGIRKDGSLWAWGSNQYGQLGIDESPSKTPRVTKPRRVDSTKKFTWIAGGAFHALALATDGTLWAWGWNKSGQLGKGDRKSAYKPHQIGSEKDWIAISTCGYHCAAQKADGSWWIWGGNADGQLGFTNLLDRTSPALVANPGVADAVYAGGFQSFARWAGGQPKAGQLTSWGRNQWGTLGRGTTDPYNNPVPTPAPIASSLAFADVASGYFHTLALLPTMSLYAWGRNLKGEIGNGAYAEAVATPIQITSLTGVTRIAAGEEFSLATRLDGGVWGWGTDKYGQLGLPGTGGSATPAYITSTRLAYLKTPKAPSSVTKGTTLSAYGIMLPNHVGPVSVAFYRKVGGTWTPIKTISAKVVRTSSGAKWSISYKPGAKGEWYLQASHQDTAHLLSTSPKRYFKVN